MYVCMYVCVCMHVYVCMYMYVCVFQLRSGFVPASFRLRSGFVILDVVTIMPIVIVTIMDFASTVMHVVLMPIVKALPVAIWQLFLNHAGTA